MQDASSRFKIGAVARLAGVSVHTISKWEERYGAVEPERTEGGGRVYTRHDMERLVLIKKLADAGHALRDLASLSLDDLVGAWRKVPGADALRRRRCVVRRPRHDRKFAPRRRNEAARCVATPLASDRPEEIH